MTIETLTQIGIPVLSGSGIWLVGRPEPWKRWGYILGLAAQPFWLYVSFTPKMWGVLLVTLFCTYGWAQGVWFHWIKPKTDRPENSTPELTSQMPERLFADTLS